MTDEAAHKEQLQKIEFWANTDFFGVDLSAALSRAREEYFSQPIVGTFNSRSLLSSQRATHTIDFGAVTPEELQVEECYTLYLPCLTLCHHIL
jgi:hypothetical protein